MEVSPENRPTQVLDLDALEKSEVDSTIEFEHDSADDIINRAPHQKKPFSFAHLLMRHSNGKIKDLAEASHIISTISAAVIILCILYTIFL